MQYAIKCVNTKPTQDELVNYKSRPPNNSAGEWWINNNGFCEAWCGDFSTPKIYYDLNVAFRERGGNYLRFEYFVQEFEE